MLSVKESNSGNPPARTAPLELHEIQATVLRQRPAYLGTHAFLRIDDAQAGRAFLRRLIPHVDSAAGCSTATDAWLAVAITYAGLEALGLPQDSLQKLRGSVSRRDGGARPATRGRRCQRSEELGPGFGKGQIHIGLSAFSDTEEKWRRAVAIAHVQREKSLVELRAAYMPDAVLQDRCNDLQEEGAVGFRRDDPALCS
jgi:deferrochelatase/peroxidase EfeB